MSKPWWRRHLLRIYHPNITEWEYADLDAKRLISDCVLTNAELIVINGGGLHALYPSKVPHHYVSPRLGGRDLLGEITQEAHAYGLRVIARVDFSKARQPVWQEHPEWFQQRPDGRVARAGEYYVTCPLGGYQNQDFAYAVLREMLERYELDGFELHSAGFDGHCTCAACEAAFGEPIPVEDRQGDPAAWERFAQWRNKAVAQQVEGYYRYLQGLQEGIFFTAELAGPASPEWAEAAGQHLPALSRFFSQLSLAGAGVSSARQWHWWTGLAAEQARALRRKRPPLIHVAAQMRDLKMPRALMPPAELAFSCYQALAHGAGVQLATCGLPVNQEDPRTMPAVAGVLSLMRQQEKVLDTMVPIASVALIWPADVLGRYALQDEAGWRLRQEFLGLYEGLRARHILFELVNNGSLAEKTLERYDTVVLPGASWLDGAQAEALAAFVQQGGRLVLSDTPALCEGNSFPPLPVALAECVGGHWLEEVRLSQYALPSTSQSIPGLLQNIGPLAVGQCYRRVIVDEGTTVWLYSAPYSGQAVSEDLGPLRPGDDPLVWTTPVGEGLVVSAATGIGELIQNVGHTDYASLLEAMITHGSIIPPHLLTDAPSSVEVTLTHWEYGVVVHLVNGSGPAPLDKPVPVGPISLSLAWDGPALADLCVPDAPLQRLACEEMWNRVRVVVPRLDAYAQVVVRSA